MVDAVAELKPNAAPNNRVNRSARSEFLIVPAVPFARPVTRGVRPRVRNDLNDRTPPRRQGARLIRVSAAPQTR